MIFPILLVLFVVLPVTELAILLKIHTYFSLGGTLALVIGTGILGASLARWQGVRQLGLIQQAVAAGKMPAPHLVDGVLILLAGAVLVTPGLITDALGFFLLFPPRPELGQALGGKMAAAKIAAGRG